MLRAKRSFESTEEQALLEERHCGQYVKGSELFPSPISKRVKPIELPLQVRAPRPSQFPTLDTFADVSTIVSSAKKRKDRDDIFSTKRQQLNKTYTQEELDDIVKRAILIAEDLMQRKYDEVLTEKLGEQFESFTTFTNDYVHKQMTAECSYMS